MEVSDKLLKYIAGGLGVLLVVGALYLAWQKHSFESQVRDLQNEVAKRDQTIEVQKDVYAKLDLQVKDLKSTIDTSTEAGKRLADEVAKSKAELVSVTNTLVKLQKQVAEGKGGQTDVPGPKPGDPTRKKVTFGQDFGYARVDGFTLTDPPEYHLELGQGSRPLKLSLALTQQKDRSWRTLVASSDPNVSLDIGVTAVNPFVLEPRWYENLRLTLDLGAGSGGVLAGVGASARFNQFDIGPKIWGVTNGGGSVFYGGSVSWSPFQR